MSLFYIPVALAAVTVLLTTAHLAFCSRSAVSNAAFTRARLAWFVLVFFGGPILSARIYESRLLSEYSGDDVCAFLITCLFLGLILAAYAGFGLYAWMFPAQWHGFLQRRDQIRAETQRQKDLQT